MKGSPHQGNAAAVSPSSGHPGTARRLSPQEQLDEERGVGLTPDRCIRFALFTIFDKPPAWKITAAAEAIHLSLRKMGFKIVPMEKGDE